VNQFMANLIIINNNTMLLLCVSLWNSNSTQWVTWKKRRTCSTL
jgi:uncharacterized membrane protein